MDLLRQVISAARVGETLIKEGEGVVARVGTFAGYF
jgi:hypothetical protein